MPCTLGICSSGCASFPLKEYQRYQLDVTFSFTPTQRYRNFAICPAFPESEGRLHLRQRLRHTYKSLKSRKGMMVLLTSASSFHWQFLVTHLRKLPVVLKLQRDLLHEELTMGDLALIEWQLLPSVSRKVRRRN